MIVSGAFTVFALGLRHGADPDHLAAIDRCPNAFLSVSLAAAGDDAEDVSGLEKCVAAFTQETGWKPRCLHHVAGAFRYTSYDFLKRWAMKYIAYRKGGPTDTSRDYELTDWDDLRQFVESFSASLVPRVWPPR